MGAFGRKTQSLLDEARERKTLNLKKLGFKGLQKELESANLSQQEQNVMYIAILKPAIAPDIY